MIDKWGVWAAARYFHCSRLFRWTLPADSSLSCCVSVCSVWTLGSPLNSASLPLIPSQGNRGGKSGREAERKEEKRKQRKQERERSRQTTLTRQRGKAVCVYTSFYSSMSSPYCCVPRLWPGDNCRDIGLTPPGPPGIMLNTRSAPDDENSASKCIYSENSFQRQIHWCELPQRFSLRPHSHRNESPSWTLGPLHQATYTVSTHTDASQLCVQTEKCGRANKCRHIMWLLAYPAWRVWDSAGYRRRCPLKPLQKMIRHPAVNIHISKGQTRTSSQLTQAWNANTLEPREVDQVCLSPFDTALPAQHRIGCAVPLRLLGHISNILIVPSGSNFGPASHVFVALVPKPVMPLDRQFPAELTDSNHPITESGNLI